MSFESRSYKPIPVWWESVMKRALRIASRSRIELDFSFCLREDVILQQLGNWISAVVNLFVDGDPGNMDNSIWAKKGAAAEVK
ncbi:hypothetical protein CEXT_122401 [Caerostris extrusa]|uniref:Uncharacterized protein n=1 Tax=Caerostris extrusa TaxID=172846 RepID=A0AAV4YAN5_CAEEX|nr:hypothetical protein CEXT_122401 [Caerostris extrusa]